MNWWWETNHFPALCLNKCLTEILLNYKPYQRRKRLNLKSKPSEAIKLMNQDRIARINSGPIHTYYWRIFLDIPRRIQSECSTKLRRTWNEAHLGSNRKFARTDKGEVREPLVAHDDNIHKRPSKAYAASVKSKKMLFMWGELHK